MLRLGLDIGTNSIGWWLVEFDNERPEGFRHVDGGARIFSDGRDPKTGASLAVDRRQARAMRRRRDRYLGRRDAFLVALVHHGLMPADADEAKLLADKDPYALRARALADRLEPYEIGRALFHLNQRRGFLSNRKAERRSKDGDDGKIASGAKALDQAMAEAGADTLGQFLAGRDEKRVRLDGEAQGYDFYPQRRHVDHEFGRIWEEQARHHPDLLTDEARAALRRILFFQRPLKEPEVGACTFVNAERRLPKAHPLFQERRLYEEVNQLEITAPGEAPRKLTLDQRDHLILMLRDKREVSFKTLAGSKGLKLQPGESFNKASETRTHLRGNEVHAALADKKRFGEAGWVHRSPEQQWRVVERLVDEENPDALHAFLLEEGLDDDRAKAAAKAPLPEGHGRLGETATRLILEELKKEVVTYDVAVVRAFPHGHHSDFRTGEILDRLPYYGELLTRDIPPGSQIASDPPEKRWGKITNPTVHIGLRQLEKLVNGVIARHGRPDQIVVELARELNLSDDDKKKHEARIRKDTAAAISRGEMLEKEGIANTGANRALMKQWQELNPANPVDRRCPYCAEPIGMHQLFGGAADVDHIIPYSRSLDDSASNKVVAHRSCNRAKGNKTPFEKWGHDAERWDRIAAQVARLHKGKQWRFGPDAMARVEKDGGFLARQLTDTQYLSRLAGKYLRSLYPTKEEGSVYVIPGRMTAMLRRHWGLNDILWDHNYVPNAHSNAPKNRLDHRHHTIDAAVVAATTRGLLKKIADAAASAEQKELSRTVEKVEQPWQGFREELRERLGHVVASHKPDHGRRAAPSRHRDVTAGRLHNDTAYGLTGETSADGRTPIVVHRVPLSSLKPADLTSPDRIPDPILRDELHREAGGLEGRDFLAALDRVRKQGIRGRVDRNGRPLFKGLRHVRVREPLNVIPIRDAAGRAYKAYKGDANARLELWRLPDGALRTRVVTMFEAHAPAAVDPRPHPAAKRLLNLRQNDLLAVERDGSPRELLRVVGFNVAGRLTLAPANQAGNLQERDRSGDDPFKYVYLSGRSILKAKARQVRIDPLGRILDPGPR